MPCQRLLADAVQLLSSTHLSAQVASSRARPVRPRPLRHRGPCRHCLTPRRLTCECRPLQMHRHSCHLRCLSCRRHAPLLPKRGADQQSGVSC